MAKSNPDGPRCPRCGEQRLIEPSGYVFYCNVCGKTSTAPPKKPDAG